MSDFAAEIASLDRTVDEASRTIEAAQERRKELVRLAGEEYGRRLAAALTLDMINLLAPNHGRTTCSDEKLTNGFDGGGKLPRCRRCALLDAMATKYWPTELRLSLDIIVA